MLIKSRNTLKGGGSRGSNGWRLCSLADGKINIQAVKLTYRWYQGQAQCLKKRGGEPRNSVEVPTFGIKVSLFIQMFFYLLKDKF